MSNLFVRTLYKPLHLVESQETDMFRLEHDSTTVLVTTLFSNRHLPNIPTRKHFNVVSHEYIDRVLHMKFVFGFDPKLKNVL